MPQVSQLNAYTFTHCVQVNASRNTASFQLALGRIVDMKQTRQLPLLGRLSVQSIV